MIARQFASAEHAYPQELFLLSSERTWSYSEFSAVVRPLAAYLASAEGSLVASYMADSPRLVGLIIAADLAGKSLLQLSRDYSVEQVESAVRRTGADLLITDGKLGHPVSCPEIAIADVIDADPPRVDGEGFPEDSTSELLVMTSGTTGEPKCARYQWSDLFGQIATKTAERQRWLLAYRLNHFAGIQMLAHVIASAGTLVLPETNSVADAVAAMNRFGVTHVSSTPTFWRFAMALIRDKGEEPNLKHITLGSEAVSATLLEQLKHRFTSARIVHIYASTESGSCVSVSDMLPGLPVSVLSRPEDAPVQFRIEEGELYIKSLHGMRQYLGSDALEDYSQGAWRATGDLVKVEDGRIVFLGRRSESINVGGVKVHPLEVEAVVSSVPGVKVARVYGEDNAVVGQIVAVDLVLEDGYSGGEVESTLRERCMSLPRHARPRSVNVVDSITTSNNKLVRR